MQRDGVESMANVRRQGGICDRESIGERFVAGKIFKLYFFNNSYNLLRVQLILPMLTSPTVSNTPRHVIRGFGADSHFLISASAWALRFASSLESNWFPARLKTESSVQADGMAKSPHLHEEDRKE